MTTPDSKPQEVLREEILAEARRESEDILRRARQEADALLAQAADAAGAARKERLELARTDAARQRELIIASVAVETGRLRAARVETLLQAVHDEARRQLLAREGFDYHEALVTLAASAVRRMAGDTFVVKLSAADRPADGEGLAEEIARRTGRSPLRIQISSDGEVAEAGLIVQDAEGRQVWDNRFSIRLKRLWPELRRQVALHASLVAGSGPAGEHA